MAEIEKINNVKSVSRSVESFQKVLERHSPNRDHFEALMQRTETVKTDVPAQEPSKQAADRTPTLMDEVSRLNSKVEGLSQHSHEQLIAQAVEAQKQISQIENQLQEPNLQLRDSVQRLLQSKLSDVQDNLSVALNKAGIDALPADQAAPGTNPVTRFLDLLANGQHNLERLSTHVGRVAESGGEIRPAALLSIQLKVHQTQQSLEFFSSLLNKALESTKTIMNVQV